MWRERWRRGPGWQLWHRSGCHFPRSSEGLCQRRLQADLLLPFIRPRGLCSGWVERALLLRRTGGVPKISVMRPQQQNLPWASGRVGCLPGSLLGTAGSSASSSGVRIKRSLMTSRPVCHHSELRTARGFTSWSSGEELVTGKAEYAQPPSGVPAAEGCAATAAAIFFTRHKSHSRWDSSAQMVGVRSTPRPRDGEEGALRSRDGESAVSCDARGGRGATLPLSAPGARACPPGRGILESF